MSSSLSFPGVVYGKERSVGKLVRFHGNQIV